MTEPTPPPPPRAPPPSAPESPTSASAQPGVAVPLSAPALQLTSAQLRPLNTAVLISAIANLIGGYVWFSSCLGVFLTAPMLVLCASEIIYFVQAPRMSRLDLNRRTTALGVFQILLGLFNLGISVLCGIYLLLSLRKLEAELDADLSAHPGATPTPTATASPTAPSDTAS